jgi:hypothetical protein
LPGFFGLFCFDDANCVGGGLTNGGLACLGADLTSPSAPQPGYCSVPCSKDDDCTKNRWTTGGWCGYPNAPFCLPAQDSGADCSRSSMCSSGLCGMNGKCG